MTYIKITDGIVTGVASPSNLRSIIDSPRLIRLLITVDETKETVPQIGWLYQDGKFNPPSEE